MNSTGVLISNLTFLNSPFWTVHPVYCSQVTVHNVTILALLNSPNTDGILAFHLNQKKTEYSRYMDYSKGNIQVVKQYSSDDVCIEDCYISTGDDLIAIKSGWDEYGIAFGRPSTNIIIHRLIGKTQTSAGIAIGSELFGGVSKVHAEDIHFYDLYNAIRIKNSPRRGGYVRNIYISNVTLANVDIAIWFTGLYGDHPDDAYNSTALPVIEKITFKDVKGENIKHAGLIEGIEGDNFANICLSNITLNVSSSFPWNCSYVKGYTDLVLPKACEPLKERIFPEHCSDCYYLSNHLQSSNNQNRGAWFLSW